MPANWQNSAVVTDWKRSVFIPIPKKGKVKEYSNYGTIVLISHTSKVMLKILQARPQQYVNWELPDVQAGFRKGRESEVAQLSPTLCDPMDWSPPGSSIHGSSQERILDCHFLLQGIFPTHGLNPGLPYGRRILYRLSHQGSPRIQEWVAYPFSRGTFQPRNRTGVSCIAGGFLTSWATQEAQIYIYFTTKKKERKRRREDRRTDEWMDGPTKPNGVWWTKPCLMILHAISA